MACYLIDSESIKTFINLLDNINLEGGNVTMKKTPLIPVVLLLITTIVAAGLISNSNMEVVEVADAPKLSSVPVYEEVYERPAGGWEFYRLVYDLGDGATPSEVDPESIQVMMNGVDITEEVKIKIVEEDPVYRLSISRYWEPGKYNITVDVSDYAGNRAIYKTILIFT